MSNHLFTAAAAPLRIALALAAVISFAARADAQPADNQPVTFRVSGAAERLEMIVNTSRILTLDYNIPRLLVDNPEIVRAAPMSPNQIQVSALKPGVTQVTVWDEHQKIHVIDILVYGDARELHNLLISEFPEASLRVRPLASSVVISGYVPRADMVSRIVTMSQDYYPKVINNMQVGGVQQILLHVKIIEVSRTKLRQFGVDWAALTGNDFVIQSVSGLVSSAATQGGTLTGTGADTVRVGILNSGNAFGAYVDLLRQYNLAKLLAEPTLVTVSGRPASFNSGGEIPVPVPAGLGVTAIQYREFGTQVDFVPIVLGNGNIRLEVRPQITEPDASLAVNGAPGFRQRRVDTGVEMKAGQTLALAGLIQNRLEMENRGIPWLADLPWIGAAFRRVRERFNEVELLIMVTPEFVEAMDPHEVPPCVPGQTTTIPGDIDFYWRGYMEVPKCDDGAHLPPAGPAEGQILGPEFSHPPYDAPPAIGLPPVIDGAGRGADSNPTRTPYASTAQSPQYYSPASASKPTAPQRGYGFRYSDESQPTLIGPVGYGELE
jgi:pilus assembly protein CpaC